MRTSLGWGSRFVIALVAAFGTAGAVGTMSWMLTSERPPVALPAGSPVELERWTVVSHGVTVHSRLESPEADEPVLPRPGASIVMATIDVTYTNEEALFESGCGVLFRTRDGSSEWKADNSAVHDAYDGEADTSCLMDPEEVEEDGTVSPAEVALGETVRVRYSAEVPSDVADQVVADFRIDSFLDRGPALRWYEGEDAAFVLEQV